MINCILISEQRQSSTYALTMYMHELELEGKTYKIEIWDTAGQDQYKNMHPSFYFGADACILTFDVTRKPTYDNLKNWYSSMRVFCSEIPCILIANKIDAKPGVTNKKFNFSTKNNLPFYFVSAADGTNVVKMFNDILKMGIEYKLSGKSSFTQDVLDAIKDN